MKIAVEFRSDMSRPETFRALQIAREAAARLAHRMTPAELDKLSDYGASLMRIADAERARRAEPQHLRAAGGPPLLEGTASVT